MKKTIISVVALTSLIAAIMVVLKFRLKPPKKEVFNFVKPLKESEQEVKEKEEESLISNDTQNLLNDIKNDYVKRRAGKATNFIVKAGDLNEQRQREYVDPNILIKNPSESSYASQKLDQSVEEALLSSRLEIEDIPQENRKLDDYIRSFKCAREISVDRYIEICRLLLEDIQSLTEKSAMTKKEGKRLLSDTVINGYDYFEDKEALDNFIIEQEEALGSTIGLFRDPNYSAEEFDKNVNNHSKDVIDLVYSAKEDLKTLSYIGRQIRNSQIRGIGFAIIVNSKYFKRPRKAYEYLVEHADEWRETPEVSDVVISDISVKISFERK